MAGPLLRIEPMGEAALLAVLGDTLDLDANARARALAAALASGGIAGVGVPVPGHASVLVPFEPEAIAEGAVRALIARAWPGAARASAEDDAPGRLHELPTRYGGEDGPDLSLVAASTGLAEAEVVRLHASVEYRVLVVGFVPGYAYLGPLPPRARAAAPRHAPGARAGGRRGHQRAPVRRVSVRGPGRLAPARRDRGAPLGSRRRPAARLAPAIASASCRCSRAAGRRSRVRAGPCRGATVEPRALRRTARRRSGPVGA
ncbi:MAG: carboxyltransferase domain-containing protein [Chloroflexota bacterium]